MAVAYGQLPVIPLPQISTESVISPPTNITSRGYRWWVSSDVTVGVTVSNQWLDRIASARLWQMNTAISPTNSALGVRFNGGQTLTNVVFDPTKGDTSVTNAWVYIIFNPDHNTGSPANKAIASAADGRGILFNTSDSLSYAGFDSGGPNTLNRVLSTGVMHDIAVAYNKTNTTWYTNGVPTLTNTTASFDDYDQQYVGNSGAPAFEGPIKMYISELFFVTNETPTSITISNMHRYATNTYGFTP